MNLAAANYQYQDTTFFVLHPSFLLLIGLALLVGIIFIGYKKKRSF
ncbi:LPXTG cell wall anchor domain-containing protein [Evansella tamaricis]|uniref:LPXTG cell wall anchor domain-containing protein n=1 Tax=Evansella tamaricis TaxID=2069301 RepID=A0ABS6JFE1_9BACI|nr:LPXTG cell wall anchor domain-containing protein [Evansella tamaricis]